MRLKSFLGDTSGKGQVRVGLHRGLTRRRQGQPRDTASQQTAEAGSSDTTCVGECSATPRAVCKRHSTRSGPNRLGLCSCLAPAVALQIPALLASGTGTREPMLSR